MTSISNQKKDPRSSAALFLPWRHGGSKIHAHLQSYFSVIHFSVKTGCLAVQHRFSKAKWKVEWKVDGNNFPLGRLGNSKTLGKNAGELSGKWNLLSTPKNSQWKMGGNKKPDTNRHDAKLAKKNQGSKRSQIVPQMNADQRRFGSRNLATDTHG